MDELPLTINNWHHEDLHAVAERLRVHTPDALGALECAALGEMLRDQSRPYESRYMEVAGILERVARKPHWPPRLTS